MKQSETNEPKKKKKKIPGALRETTVLLGFWEEDGIIKNKSLIKIKQSSNKDLK